MAFELTAEEQQENRERLWRDLPPLRNGQFYLQRMAQAVRIMPEGAPIIVTRDEYRMILEEWWVETPRVVMTGELRTLFGRPLVVQP